MSCYFKGVFILLIATTIVLEPFCNCNQDFILAVGRVLKDIKNLKLNTGNINHKGYEYNLTYKTSETIKKDNYKEQDLEHHTFKPSTISKHLNLSDYPGELCYRRCVKGEQRICYFQFTLEYYQAMGVACGRCAEGVVNDCLHEQCIVGDGVRKGVMSINRQIPGPSIHVCKDDLVVVDVHNKADGTAAALHWHGVHMTETPFMDGVPFLTQCPINFGNSFRYKFRATEPGTQFYHSHSGHHKANGQYGSFIIRQPEAEQPLKHLYDYDLAEHQIIISDWLHLHAEQNFDIGDKGLFPDSVLINGRGIYTDPKTSQRIETVPTVFYVQPGKRYRFRLINSINFACPFQLQIQKHNFTVIASDSFYLQPDVFDTLVSNAGERYDFILNANHTKGEFWVRVRSLGFCAGLSVESFALITYKQRTDEKYRNSFKFPAFNKPFPELAILNHPNLTCCSQNYRKKSIVDMSALEEDKELLLAKPDHTFFVGFNSYNLPKEDIFKKNHFHHFSHVIANVTSITAINNISFSFPSYVPLTQPELIDENEFCDSNTWPSSCKNMRFCHCTHSLKAKLNSIVELIIVDETEMRNPINHPFHLHGYRFMVTSMAQDTSGMTVNRARQLDEGNQLPRLRYNEKNYPFKDTVSIPSRGYVIVRFKASNPGFWLMHCHYEWHLATGMGLVMQIGETSQMIRPPRDFPKCSNYIPPIDKSELLPKTVKI